MTDQSGGAGAQPADRRRREPYAVVLAALVGVLLMTWMTVSARSQLLDRTYDEQVDLVNVMGSGTFQLDGAIAHCPAVNVGGKPVLVVNISDVAVVGRPCESSAADRRILATATVVMLAVGSLVVVLLAVWRLRRAAHKAASTRAP